MSDAAITIIVTGLVNVATMLVGFLTLWVRLKYGEQKADQAARTAAIINRKVDENTSLTTEVKASAEKASQHVEGCDERMKNLNSKLADHDARIAAVEARVTAVQAAAESLGKNVDSTRHEMRGHLQAVVNKLDLLMLAKGGSGAGGGGGQQP